MTWLGYEIILTNDQKIAALIFAVLFALFGRWCGRPWALCVVVVPVVYLMACLYSINENAMYQLKAEFCAKHPEVEHCAAYRG